MNKTKYNLEAIIDNKKTWGFLYSRGTREATCFKKFVNLLKKGKEKRSRSLLPNSTSNCHKVEKIKVQVCKYWAVHVYKTKYC